MVFTAERETVSRIVTRSFSGRSPAAQAIGGPSCPEAQAALRQFSLERLMAYGVHHADAIELRGRVTAGEQWQGVAMDLADTCLTPPEVHAAPLSTATRANRLYRASALVRMSQMMMLTDNDERRDLYVRAAELYDQAAVLTADRRKLLIETEQGPLVSWLFPCPEGEAIGCAVVIGGVEGWAMDFDGVALALARRGVETLALDGPGQGESRMVHHHYLGKTWTRSYAGVFDYLIARTGGLPLAFVGNSVGGALAMHLAACDARIAACCDNGGPRALGWLPANTSFFTKMAAHCGDVPEDSAAEVWQTVKPAAPDSPLTCPLLIVHGGMDPLVSTDDATTLFEATRSVDKQMVIYSDGNHCVYNHNDDKHNLIGDWVSSRLGAVSTCNRGMVRQ